MDPVTRAALANTIIPATRIGETAGVTPATAAAIANARAAPLVASAQVDISPLGQFLSGVALSRRQLLALQGAAEQPGGASTVNNLMPDVLAVAEQLTQSFAQLQTSGIDASQLANLGNGQDNLAQRYDLLSGDGTTNTDAALAQNGNLLTQAGLARIGVDLRGEQVDPAALQAAFGADRNGTLDALQQGTDVMARVGAVLAQQQGQAAASAVDADLNGQVLSEPLVQQAATPAPAAANVQARQQAEALAQRQLEVQQQMENEELVQDMQSLQDTRQLQEQQVAERLQAQQQIRQAQQTLPSQPALQGQNADAAAQRTQALQDEQQRVQAARSEREDVAAQSVAQEQQLQQQAVTQAEEVRQNRVQTAQAQQAQLEQRAQQAADEAAQAQLDASEAQILARAAAERAQQLAREAQTPLGAGQVATAQAQLAQQNLDVQQRAAQNAAQLVAPPSSQDPSVAAAIAAYNLTNTAAGLVNRPAGDAQRPLVAPVAAVEPAKPVNRIQASIDSSS